MQIPMPAKTATSHSDELFRIALEAAPTGMLLIDPAGRITLVNAQLERLFGYPRTELIGCLIEQLVPQRYRARHPEFRDEFFRDPQTRTMGIGRELFGLRRDGSEVPVEIGLTPVNASEGRFVLASIVDITERRRALEQLRERTNELGTSLRERELLLQEVHHRVKNNLQLISSLMNMQARKAATGESRLALAECKRRVEAIGLIHEKLYQSHSYAEVPFSDYVRSLAANLLHTDDQTAAIELDCQCDVISLPVDKAISCGLLLNELIICALKHVLAQRTGRLHLELRRPETGRIHLTVRDCGIDLAGRADSTRPLGLQLIDMLAQQLNGDLHTTAVGTVTVSFPLA